MGKPRHQPGPAISALNHNASRQLGLGHEIPQHNCYRPDRTESVPLPGPGTHPSKTSP